MTALQAMKFDQQGGQQPPKALPPWTLHDLRRSCTTGIARIGIQPHVIEAVLNHSSGFRAGAAGVYQRHPYLVECGRAVDSWADHVLRLKTPQEPAAQVISLRKGPR